jgi:2-polyprenyl-3-methyl-5-hydroxy-6-metoxy-1,4-benzoquinol methylase/Tfp pilus assembly protein PilF
MASGALLLTDPADGLLDLFRDGEHLVVYRSRAELFEKIAWYLGHEEERARIAAQGRAHVLAFHTYEVRVAEMLTILRNLYPERLARETAQPGGGGYYECVRAELFPHVPKSARRLLDIGCAAGAFGRSMKSLRGMEVVGVEYVPEVAERAKTVLDAVHTGSIEHMDLPYADGYFDCMTCFDVLEHLVEPAEVLHKLKRMLAPDGVIVISIPNVQFYAVQQTLSGGRFPYMDSGILDRTHLRFFTREELRRLIAEAGLEVRELTGLNVAGPDFCPRAEDGSVRLGHLLYTKIDDERYEDLRIYQFLVVAGHPTGNRIEAAREALAQQRNQRALEILRNAEGEDETERQRLLGKVHARLGDATKALQALEKALAMRPDDPELAGELGVALVAVRRHDDARPLLERALAADPHNARARGAIGLLLLHEEEPEKAFQMLREALESSFEHTGLLGPFILAARHAEREEEAVPILEKFAEFYPGNMSLACQLVEMNLEAGAVDEARARLEPILILDPENEAARALKARIDAMGDRRP